MNILVTGGAGFIGSNFIHYWLIAHPQDQIINLDKLTYAGNLENLADIERSPNLGPQSRAIRPRAHGRGVSRGTRTASSAYTFIKGDICDPKTVGAVLKDVDIVVNFAAESHVDRSILDPAPFIKTNVVGTQVLLDAALEAKVKRFHHVSTDEVFGALSLTSKERFNEKTPYSPRSPYAASKAASDHLVRAYHITYGLPITITNCSNNFGPFQFPEKLISLAITNLLQGKKVPVYGDGLYVRDWLYVEDHCRAIDLVLEKGKVGETYCIGVDSDIPNIEVVKRLLKLLGKGESQIEHVKDRPGHDRRYAIDSAKIKKELGWEAKYDFDQALSQTVDWYKEHESWWKKLKDKKFKEYYQKQYVKR